MKFLTVSLTVLSLSASNLASQGRVMKPGNDDGYPDDAITKDNRDKWDHKRDMEMWQDNGNGRWRRDRDYDDDFEDRHHPRRGGRWEDRRDRGSRRGDGGRRWNRDDGRLGNGNDKNFAPHPPTNPNPPPHGVPSQQPNYPDNQQPNDRDNIGTVMPPAPVITTMFPPLPIIIEPIRSRPVALPSIIEPYPEVIETSYSVNYPTPTNTYVPTSSAYIPTSSAYGPTSSAYIPISYAPVSSVNKKAAVPVYHSNSTTVYASTVIMTEPEETVTTKVTGRYRAMSNAAAGNNLAGSISFTIILLSSVFLIALV